MADIFPTPPSTGARAPLAGVAHAEVVVPCAGGSFDASLAFFGELGFRVEAIFPADAPSTASLSAYGLRLRLEGGADMGDASHVRLRLLASRGESALPLGESIAPCGARILVVEADSPVVVPPRLPEAALCVQRMGQWSPGRAGLLYRDLLPGRLNGRVIASHIRVESRGPVRDYVHFHKVRFQLIYCVRGHVTVVYEDAGPPFTMHAGDCVLQPPQIRHRVLESSDALEVVEIAVPAVHETIADPSMLLPNTATTVLGREFHGQRFTRHVAAEAAGRWRPCTSPSVGPLEDLDLGIRDATSGLASARILRRSGGGGVSGGSVAVCRGEAAPGLHFVFVLPGSTAALSLDGAVAIELGASDACALPPGAAFELTLAGELLEVTMRDF